jgi:TonB family protein
MRFYLLLLFLTGFLFQSQAQTLVDTIVYIEKDTINPIDVQPEFPGGEMAFTKFIMSRIIYPEDAKNQRIQGTTYITFIIEKDGSLSNFKAVDGKSLYPSCDQAAINAISPSPRWKPGLKNNLPVRVRKIVRIKFNLN